MSTTSFTVGQRYANAHWEYQVQEIKGTLMVVQSADGQLRTLHIETAARLWDELQAREKRRAARKRAASRT
jgi:hypothetical protein